MPATSSKVTIAFCHGLWADGSCFNKVIPALQAEGHEVVSVQYGLDSYDEDLSIVKRTLDRVDGPVLLVGHSYGGAVITGAGMDERVVGLVYITAVAPDAGETVQGQLNQYPTEIFNHLEMEGNRVWLKSSGMEFLAGDLTEADQKLVWATQFAPDAELIGQQKLTIDQVAWRHKPSWYLLATDDRTVHPDLQRWVSARMGADLVETASSHVPMLSQPDVVLEVIRKAAAAVMKG